MRPALRVLRAVAALGGAAALVVPAFTPSAGAEDETVQVGSPDNRFAPATVRIRPGDTVTWQYAGGTGHTVTSTTRNWQKNDPVGPPAVLSISTSYMFDAPGTYRYVCSTHESVGMRGTVVVEGTRRPRRTPTPRPTTSSPRPSPTRTPTSVPTATPSASPSGSPTPTPSTATPVPPLISDPAVSPPPRTPFPTVAPTPPDTRSLGSGGLTPHPATGRGKGLPVLLALLLIGGVGSAEIRTLLAHAPPE